MSAFAVETIALDLPSLAVEFSARLDRAGVPAGPDRSACFARSLTLVRPVSRTRLYWTARAAFVTDRAQVPGFNAVFAEVFGSGFEADAQVPAGAESVPAPEDERPAVQRQSQAPAAAEPPLGGAASAPERSTGDRQLRELEIPILASDEERLRSMRFDALAPAELSELYRLMARLQFAAPVRRVRRRRRHRHGRRVDVRATMRASMRTGGDAVQLVRRRRRVLPRRIVMICDISGSMEPYARAYLQFLTCVAGGGIRSGGAVEAFVFATRLTRVTRALATRSPERAIQRAAAAAPDWSGGTRIGEAIGRFNDRYGRRGMARGAVIVILSDGWERGDPSALARELERLSRLAFRIIWVNPRVAARGYQPKAAGMAAALPFIDALVGGESLAALEQVVEAIGNAGGPLPGSGWTELGSGRRQRDVPAAAPSADSEPWGSATPVRGSSVAMPSGWSPGRGNTTPGWG